MRRVALAASLLLIFAQPAAAQIPFLGGGGDDFTYQAFYPKIFWTSKEGFTGGLYAGFIQEMRFEDFEAPAPYRAATSINGQISASGTWWARLEWRAPYLVQGWRFVSKLELSSWKRDNYFGVGNDTDFDGNNVTDQNPHFYQAKRQQYELWLEAQRRLVGHLNILLGATAASWKLDTLPGESVLATDAAAGDTSIGKSFTDVSGRIGLVFDTRDNEIEPSRGVLLQGIIGGAVGDVDYARFTVGAQGYLPLSKQFSVVARAVGQGMTGSPPTGSLYRVESANWAYYGLGGPDSHKALNQNRFLGQDKIFGNLMLRYRLPLLFPSITLYGYADAGRVFQDEDFKVDFADYHVGGGGGAFVTAGLLVMGFSAGGASDGFVANFHTRWPF